MPIYRLGLSLFTVIMGLLMVACPSKTVNNPPPPTGNDAPQNKAPTDIRLSKATIPENAAANTVVGGLSTTDDDADDTHVYSLIAGGSDFNIDGNSLRVSKVFDYETKSSYAIKIQTDDGNGDKFEKDFTITVTDANDAPMAIMLSKDSIAENNSVNALVGTFTTTDADAGDSYTYTLVSGGSNFNINTNELRASKSFDYETKNSYPIRIRTSDGKGGTFQKDFTITVINGNDAPTNITLSQTSITENNATNAVIGTLSTTDADASDTHTYTLVSGGDDFNISGDSLRASKAFDYESDAKSYVITIRTSDGKGGTFQKDFTITITDDTHDVTMTFNGKTYKTIKIGDQWWLAENLNDASHSSGNSVCYENKNGNCDTYGRLYDWEAAKAIADQIPGWHLPTDDEWKTLEMSLGMSQSDADKTSYRGSPVGSKLKQGDSSGFDGAPRWQRHQRRPLLQLDPLRLLLVEFAERK